MKQVIELLKQTVADCMQKGEMFRFPRLNRNDVNVTSKEVEPHGSVIFSEEYRIEFDNGGWINIEYESKDKDRTFQINPDRSIIHVTCSNSSLNFTDAWDERLYGR